MIDRHTAEFIELDTNTDQYRTVIDYVNKKTGLKWNQYTISEQNRIGDHIWYISDLTKFKTHFPDWKITKSLENTIDEMIQKERTGL
jgi:CDP-paratose 2-epimerase